MEYKHYYGSNPSSSIGYSSLEPIIDFSSSTPNIAQKLDYDENSSELPSLSTPSYMPLTSNSNSSLIYSAFNPTMNFCGEASEISSKASYKESSSELPSLSTPNYYGSNPSSSLGYSALDPMFNFNNESSSFMSKSRYESNYSQQSPFPTPSYMPIIFQNPQPFNYFTTLLPLEVMSNFNNYTYKVDNFEEENYQDQATFSLRSYNTEINTNNIRNYHDQGTSIIDTYNMTSNINNLNANDSYSVSESLQSGIDTQKFFSPTRTCATLVSAEGVQVTPFITVKVDRGFFINEGVWNCYRRNYFQVSSYISMEFGNSRFFNNQETPTSQPQLWLVNERMHISITRFMVKLSARSYPDMEEVELVQHTPKRDKGPRAQPDTKPIFPAFQSNPLLPSQAIAQFERLQFKKATANNGKRRAAQQFFALNIELIGELENGSQVILATATSKKILVRGRSPGHYLGVGAVVKRAKKGEINSVSPYPVYI